MLCLYDLQTLNRKMQKINYPTNFPEKQWQGIEHFLDNKERMRKKSLNEIINALFYLLKTGCRQRMLPKDFPKWQLSILM